MKRIEEDLTTGNVCTKLVKLSIPLFFINLLQSFYNIVDMIVVGQVLGSTGVVFGYNSICSILRGFGETKQPLYFQRLLGESIFIKENGKV
ncbi:hypothetical protein [Clostridioides sp. ZZV15-6388]|uniref:hypothetical protein n=1 Tax=unclassified Clostridioides TaxID=2635829 RepID=UPI001D100DEB|nr:hypothetical protein [Clostridioides sp. ZZV15-6388]MCC0665752.1 hypothetical protein [Clostridioides sp. ZZV15-6597]